MADPLSANGEGSIPIDPPGDDADGEDELVRQAREKVGLNLKDKWTLDRLVGVGGMAAVYAATHRNGKRVAVKMLHAQYSIDQNVRTRFLREGYAANKVGHRGAVTVDDDDVAEDGSAFIVMELLDGEPLDARMMRKGGTLPAEEVLSISDQLLDTLAAAHDAGVVHRDLKPENLFLTRDGVLKVLDFGIARLAEMGAKSHATQAGSMMGTPAFMPPEQARARWSEVDNRSDLWAVGASMFNLLTGQNVHEAETVTEALAMAVTQPARSLGDVAPDLHPAVIGLIDKALKYDKADRWQNADEMQAALRKAYTSVHGGVPIPEAHLSIPDNDYMEIDGADPSLLDGVRPKGATTGGGMSATLPADASPSSVRTKKSGTPALWAGLGAAALAFGGVGLWLFSGSEPVEATPTVPTGVSAAVPPPPATSVPEVTPAESDEKAESANEPRADDITFETLDEEPEEQPEAEKPAAPKPKVRATRVVQKKRKAAAPKPAPAPAPSKPAGNNPFSTRY